MNPGESIPTPVHRESLNKRRSHPDAKQLRDRDASLPFGGPAP